MATRSGGKVTAGATLDVPIAMSVETLSTSITVNETISMAAATAPSGNTLEAVSAKTEVTGEFIRNFMSPLADFSEYVNLAPGTFSLNPNGIGLGQGKTYFRGFQDGQYTMTFDGIPFEDTNTPTHHSWANFPSGWTDAVDFDRSPGLASNFGPTNFGGSINLQSPQLLPDPDIRASVVYGSWNTRLLQLDADSGFFGPGSKNSFLINIKQLLSDGYQTYNHQKRDAGYGKYQYRSRIATVRSPCTAAWWTSGTTRRTPPIRRARRSRSSETTTCWTAHPCWRTARRTPSITATTTITCRPISNMPASTPIWATAGSSIPRLTPPATGISSSIRTEPRSTSRTAKPSGVDKLNGYRHAGDTVILSKESKWGMFRTGLWYDWAYTDRYQISVQHPHSAWIRRSATSTNISSRSRSSRLPNSNGKRRRNW